MKTDEVIKGGAKNLHIVADFDRTLTKAIIDDKKHKSTFSYIRDGGYLGEEYSKIAYELFDKYYPFESDPEVSLEIKKQKMEEWWAIHLKVMVEHGMSKEIVKKVVEDGAAESREGLNEFLEMLHEKKIPLLIFSSGLGDIIVEFLKREGHDDKNIHVVANFFDFSEDGKAKGYKGKLIHVLSKGEFNLDDHDYVKEIKERKNVILLRDSLGDVRMADGIEHDLVLKIGFLNENGYRQDEYEKNYDILILDDGPMDEVNEIIAKIS
jgi:cytosolic 5'-nucleotidase 3